MPSAEGTSPVNSTPISQAAAAAREDSRQGTGEFGTQQHADPGIVDAPEPFPNAVKAAMNWFQTAEVALLSMKTDVIRKWAVRAWCDFNEFDIGMWDWEIAIGQLHDDAVAQSEATTAAGQEITWEMAAVHLERVAREANRRHLADEGVQERRLCRGAGMNVEQAFTAVREGLANLADVGLLPPGTSVTVDCGLDGDGGRPYTLVTLHGLPDRLAQAPYTNTEGVEMSALTTYGGHVRDMLQHTAAAYQNRTTANYYTRTEIESDAARELREARTY